MSAASIPRRFASIDALRGCTVAAMLLVNDPGDWSHIYWPLEHSVWNGCTPTDLVFPFFLFVVGVSVALGIEPRVQPGVAKAPLRKAVLWRALRVVGLGLALNLLGWWVMPQVTHFRVPGVLQRIGVCFAATAILAIDTRPRTQAILVAALLLGYAWLLHWGGTLEPWANIVSRVDSAVFQSHVYEIDPASGRGHDPEGLLGTLPSLIDCLLGLFAGRWLRQGRPKRLIGAGLLILLAGLAWSFWLPWNKNLWTSSFALWTSGWGMLAVALFHWLVDVRGLPPLGRRFGVNAVAAYALSDLLIFLLVGTGWLVPLYDRLFAGTLAPQFGPWIASLAFALVFVAVCWLVVGWMDRRRWYLKL
jgi:predicted acyltransferase